MSVSEVSLISSYDGDGSALLDDPLFSALEHLDLPLDSHVTVARPGPNGILLQDVYRLVKGQPLTVTPHFDWGPPGAFPVAPRRDNYRGIVFPAATVASTIFIIIVFITNNIFEEANIVCVGLNNFGLSCQFLLRFLLRLLALI
jgi:hypothetical protein